MWMSTFELYLKRDSNIGVFQWFLWIIQEHLFCRISTNGWFWNIPTGSLFNKVAHLKIRRPWAVLERDCSTCISLWILWNFYDNFFAEHLQFSRDVVFLFVADQWSLQPKINLFGGNNGKLGEGIHKTVQSDVVIETRWEFHCHTCTELGIENKRKGRTEKLVKVA